ncbi:SIS domain-containing protein [Kamptonema cortianum]|nr:SIS domain-containing protein [Geitlerinema splendidum]MDK3158581.1 SIS domain-containing protein [Kamptonema cortianum]
MEQEICEQPAVLAKNANDYFDATREFLAGQEFDMVLLAARGSSDNAALYARYLIEIHLGIPVSLAAPSVITRYQSKMKYPKTLAIGISQSGAAPDVSEVLGFMRSQGHTTIAITNTAGSRLTQVADATVLLNAGDENSIAATKTYTSSLLALYQVIRAMGAELDDPIGSLPTESWLESCRKQAASACGHIVRCSPVFCLGRGYSYCTAVETALKLMECALISAKSYSTADFEHGPKALASHGTACIVSGEIPDGLTATGSVVIPVPAGTEGALAPIWNIFFGQWIALLAARARGLNPDRAQNLRKVTETL